MQVPRRHAQCCRHVLLYMIKPYMDGLQVRSLYQLNTIMVQRLKTSKQVLSESQASEPDYVININLATQKNQTAVIKQALCSCDSTEPLVSVAAAMSGSEAVGVPYIVVVYVSRNRVV